MIEDSRLIEDGFEELPKVVKPSGVYLLLRGVVVVYVGKSKNVYSRMSQHYYNMKKGMRGYRPSPIDCNNYQLRFDQALVHWCAWGELDKLEVYYINRYKPKWNVYVPAVLPELNVDIMSLAEELGFANWKKQETTAPIRRRTIFNNRVLAKVTLPKLKFMEEESA